VIFAVVVGMASGANHLVVALVGMGIVTAASPVLWPRRRFDGWIVAESTLALRIIPEQGVQAATEQLLAALTERCDLTSVSTARQGAALDLSYRVRMRPGGSPSTLLGRVARFEGGRERRPSTRNLIVSLRQCTVCHPLAAGGDHWGLGSRQDGSSPESAFFGRLPLGFERGLAACGRFALAA
jgi:hypothetical protein